MPGKNKSEGVSKESCVAADKPAFSLISQEKLLQLYATMVKCRMVEERLCLLGLQTKADGVLEAGRGASLVGATIDLVRGDAVAPSRWQFLVDLARATLPEKTLRRLVARIGSRGSSGSSAGSRFASAIPAAQIRKKKRKSKVVVAFADLEEVVAPSWRKSLAVAVRQRLPIVLVVPARRLATVADSEERDGMEDPRPRVAVRGLPAIVVDGDDAVAVYRVAYEAIARARRGLGPTLIECEPYRVEAPANGRTRTQQRRRGAKGPQGDDSIAKMEFYLQRKGHFTPESRQRIEAAFSEELDNAVRAARGAVARQPSR